MAINGEALLSIDLVDFYKFLNTYNVPNVESVYGPPRVNIDNGTLDVEVLISDDCDPHQWTNYPETKVAKQWKNISKEDIYFTDVLFRKSIKNLRKIEIVLVSGNVTYADILIQVQKVIEVLYKRFPEEIED